MKLEHFDGQYGLITGVINLQFNYSPERREVVWISIFPSSTAGLPDRLQLTNYDGKWCFKHEYTLANGNSRTDIYSNETTDFIIEKMFEQLKQRGFINNAYFS